MFVAKTAMFVVKAAMFVAKAAMFVGGVACRLWDWAVFVWVGVGKRGWGPQVVRLGQEERGRAGSSLGRG